MSDDSRRAGVMNAVIDMPRSQMAEEIIRLMTERDAAIAHAEAAERVVEAARAVDAAFDNDEFDTTNIVVETVILRLGDAVAEYDATRGGSE